LRRQAPNRLWSPISPRHAALAPFASGDATFEAAGDLVMERGLAGRDIDRGQSAFARMSEDAEQIEK